MAVVVGGGWLSIVVERRSVTAGMSEQRWNEGECRRRERGAVGGHRFVNIPLGLTPLCRPDNKFDLISIVPQVPLESDGRGGGGRVV